MERFDYHEWREKKIRLYLFVHDSHFKKLHTVVTHMLGPFPLR